MKKLILLFVVLFVGKVYSQQTDKVLVLQKSDLKIWVHTKSIIKENEYVTFWSEWEYITEEQKNEKANRVIDFIKDYEKDTEIDIIKWSKFNSTKEQICIDISDKTYNSIQSIYYTSAGEPLYNYKFNSTEWRDVIPETIIEKVYDYVEEYTKTNLK